MSLATAKEMSVDAAVAAVRSEARQYFHIKRQTKKVKEGFSQKKRCFTLLLTGKSSVEHDGGSRLGAGIA